MVDILRSTNLVVRCADGDRICEGDSGGEFDGRATVVTLRRFPTNLVTLVDDPDPSVELGDEGVNDEFADIGEIAPAFLR